MRVLERWGKGTAAYYQPAYPVRYFRPASGAELDGVSRGVGCRLSGTDKCFSLSSQSLQRSKFEWTYSAVL